MHVPAMACHSTILNLKTSEPTGYVVILLSRNLEGGLRLLASSVRSSVSSAGRASLRTTVVKLACALLQQQQQQQQDEREKDRKKKGQTNRHSSVVSGPSSTTPHSISISTRGASLTTSSASSLKSVVGKVRGAQGGGQLCGCGTRIAVVLCALR
eukprot:COSAG05_NODE_105_length_18793_cov_115.346421_15_plen_155_part_00